MKRAALLLACVLVGGCAKRAVEPVRQPPQPGSSVATARNITSKQFDDSHRPVWSLRMGKGDLSLDEHSGTGQFSDVAGSIYRQGSEAGRLSAAAGSADSSTGVVSTSGGVEFRSQMQGADIRASRMEWRSRDNLLVASGNVAVSRGRFQMHEPGAVYADTAARRIWVRSKEGSVRSAKALIPLIGIAAAAHGHSVIQIGNVTIEGYTQMSGDLSNPNVIHATCKGPAVHLSAPDYGMDFVGTQIDATILPKAKSGEGLKLAKSTGGVRFAFTNPEGDTSASRYKSASGTAGSATYDGEKRVLDLQGGVHLTVVRRGEADESVESDTEAALVTLAKTGNDAVFIELTDHGHGRMTMPPGREVTGFDKATLDRSDPTDSRADVNGDRVRLRAPDRGLDLTASHVDLTFTDDASVPAARRLSAANASGSVRFDLAGLESVVPPDEKGRTVHEVSGSADRLSYTRSDGKLMLKGNVDLTIAADWFEPPGMHSRNDEAVISTDPATNKVLSFDLSNKNGRGTATGTAKKEPKKR